jgi:hypothetical protein
MRSLTLLLGLLAALGCTRNETTARTASTTPAAVRAGATASVADAGSSARSETFEVKMSVEPGASRLVLHIAALNGFHVNAEYPHNFKPDGSSEGVTFDKPRFDLQGTAERSPCPGSHEDSCAMSAAIPFQAPSAGQPRVAGVLSFSVCSAEKCLIEKVPLAAAVR